MKRRLGRVIVALMAAVLFLPSFSAHALLSEPSRPAIDCTAGVVLNLEKGEILFEKNMDVQIPTASFTKLMTGLLACEYREKNGNVTVTVTEEMLSSVGGTNIGLKVGEVITFDDLITALCVANANDAALVLASVAGGSVTAFVEQMNRRARELGMTHTYYTNPTGVDSAMMFTTMRDTLLLARAVWGVNEYVVTSSLPQGSIPATNKSKERTFTNKNALIPFSYVTDYYMKGVRGLIAGYTGEAGHCLATVREKNGCTNLVILSGGTDYSEGRVGTEISSYRDAKVLLEWAENTFSIHSLMEEGSVMCERGVRLSADVDHVILVAARDLQLLLPADVDVKERVTVEINTLEEVFTAPIIEGDAYGKAVIYLDGKEVGSVPLVARFNVSRSPWLVVWNAVGGFFSGGAARIILILVIVAAVLYLAVLIFSVWRSWRRRGRDRRLAIEEINRQEDLRLHQIKQEEKRLRSANLKRARTFLRAGYRVLSGDAELVSADKKKTPERKGVAKVPASYRKKSSAPSATGRPSLRRRPHEDFKK